MRPVRRPAGSPAPILKGRRREVVSPWGSSPVCRPAIVGGTRVPPGYTGSVASRVMTRSRGWPTISCVFAPAADRSLPDRSRAGPTARDVALAAGLGLFMLVGTFGNEYGPGTRHPDAGAAALVLAIAACLTVRRRHPVPVLTAVWVLTLGYFLARYPYAPVWLGLVVAYYTAVVTGHRLAGAVAGVSGFLVFP
ncbi:MAG: hypothetical protein QOH66_1804, partial [Actinomycetota bacterium]|nr:hypothetical protein [Actinomycetota bacterium]